jgi:hypothetical protein
MIPIYVAFYILIVAVLILKSLGFDLKLDLSEEFIRMCLIKGDTQYCIYYIS